jgi:hypothetical protein
MRPGSRREASAPADAIGLVDLTEGNAAKHPQR